jgi:uncharacterized protein
MRLVAGFVGTRNMSSPKIHPLHRAVMIRSLSDVTQALAADRDPDPLDREGRSPIFYATQDGDLPILQKLIDSGAAVNLQDKSKETALHFAARSFQPDAARLLIERGAIVDIQDVHGNTALFHAVYDSQGRGELITLLLRSGANRALKNNYDVSPEDLARTIANYDIACFFDS